MKKYVLITLEDEPSDSVKDALDAISIEVNVSDPKTATALVSTIEKLANIEKAQRTKKKMFGDNVLMTEEEYEKLVAKFGKKVVDGKIEDMNDYAELVGVAKFRAKYASHSAALNVWLRKDTRNETRTTKRNSSKVDVGNENYGQFTK